MYLTLLLLQSAWPTQTTSMWLTTLWVLLLELFYPRLEIGLVEEASGKRRMSIPLQVAVTVLLKQAVTVRLVTLKMAITVLLKLAITLISLTRRKREKKIVI